MMVHEVCIETRKVQVQKCILHIRNTSIRHIVVRAQFLRLTKFECMECGCRSALVPGTRRPVYEEYDGKPTWVVRILT